MPISLELPAWVVREQARTVLRWMLTTPLHPPVDPTEAQVDAMVAAIRDGRFAQAMNEVEHD